MNNKNKFKKLFLLSTTIVLALGVLFFNHFFLNSYIKSTFAYETCDPSNQTYDFLPGYIFPLSREKSENKAFQGYSLYRYFYPGCPRYNTDDREKLFEFEPIGVFSAFGNIAIRGSKTFLLGGESVTFYTKIFKEGADEYKNYITFNRGQGLCASCGGNEDSITINKNLIVKSRDQMFYNRESKSGASLYFDSKSDDINLGEIGSNISARKGNKISGVFYDYNNTDNQCDFEKIDYLGDERIDFNMDNPSSFDLIQETDHNVYFVADKGNNRVVIGRVYNSPPSTDINSLGNRTWSWEPEGIVAGDKENVIVNQETGQTSLERMVYVTDSLKDKLIKTGINGHGWQEWTHHPETDYYCKFKLTGDEEIKLEGMSGSIAEKAEFYDSGHKRYKTEATSTAGAINIDGATQKPNFKDTNDWLFGHSSYHFNGQEKFFVVKPEGIRPGREPFAIDLWMKFDSLANRQVFAHQSGGFSFYWNGHDEELIFEGFEVGNNNKMELKTSWEPDTGKWYHLAVTKENDYRLFINGNLVSTEPASDGGLVKTEDKLNIGAEAGGNYGFRGNMDNFRIFRGISMWTSNFSPPYYFDKIGRLAEAGNYLYVLDRGNSRVVKINKNFDNYWWDSFGEEGSAKYGYIDPVDISIVDNSSSPSGYNFYVVDAENNSVTLTDMASTSNRFQNIDMYPASWSGRNFNNFYSFNRDYDLEPAMVMSDNFSNNSNGWQARNTGADLLLRSDGMNRYLKILTGDSYCDLNYYKNQKIKGSKKRFPVGAKKLDDYIRNRNYEGNQIKVTFKIRSGENPYDSANKYHCLDECGPGSVWSTSSCVNYWHKVETCQDYNGDGCKEDTFLDLASISSTTCAGANPPPESGEYAPPYYSSVGNDSIPDKRKVYVHLTKEPGGNREYSDEKNSGFSLMRELTVSNSWDYKEFNFTIPERVDFKDVYLTFSSECGIIDLAFVKVFLEAKSFKPGAIEVGNYHSSGSGYHDLYITDINNGKIMKFPGISGDPEKMFGAKNPLEKDEVGGPDYPEYKEHLLRFYNPVDLIVYPESLPYGNSNCPEDSYYILDGVSGRDMTATTYQ